MNRIMLNWTQKKSEKTESAQFIHNLVYVQLGQALQGDQGHQGIHLGPENQ